MIRLLINLSLVRVRPGEPISSCSIGDALRVYSGAAGDKPAKISR